MADADSGETDDGGGEDSDRPDSSRLDDLRSLGGATLLRDVVVLFETHAPLRLATAGAASAARDYVRAAFPLHALKATCAQLGARRMARLCNEAERAALAADGERLEALLVMLRDELVVVKAWLRLLG